MRIMTADRPVLRGLQRGTVVVVVVVVVDVLVAKDGCAHILHRKGAIDLDP
jgi:hypothetical protein